MSLLSLYKDYLKYVFVILKKTPQNKNNEKTPPKKAPNFPPMPPKNLPNQNQKNPSNKQHPKKLMKDPELQTCRIALTVKKPEVMFISSLY